MDRWVKPGNDNWKNDRFPHPSPDADAFPQRSCGRAFRRMPIWSCWRGPTAPARPTASRRFQSPRQAAACGVRRCKTSPISRATHSWAVSAESGRCAGSGPPGIDCPGQSQIARPAVVAASTASWWPPPPHSAIICAWCGPTPAKDGLFSGRALERRRFFDRQAPDDRRSDAAPTPGQTTARPSPASAHTMRR